MWHVYPLNDTKEHTFEDAQCECNPRVDTTGVMLILHNSFDGREAVESANKILNSPQGHSAVWRGFEKVD